MYLISAKGYKNTGVHTLIIKKTCEIWVSMKIVHSGLGVKKTCLKQKTLQKSKLKNIK